MDGHGEFQAFLKWMAMKFQVYVEQSGRGRGLNSHLVRPADSVGWCWRQRFSIYKAGYLRTLNKHFFRWMFVETTIF